MSNRDDANSGFELPGVGRLIDKIDLFLTGVGDFSTSIEDPWFAELINMENIDVIKKYSSGNIGGLLLPKQGINADQRALLDEIADRSFGINRAQAESCANGRKCACAAA